MTQFRYSRVSHLETHLRSLQSLASVAIETDVVREVGRIIRKNEGVIDSKDISVHMVRSALKILKKSHLYKHVTQIHWMLTSIEPPRLTSKQTERVISLFEQLSDAFDTLVQTGVINSRQNFVSYPFCLFKIFQLLGKEYNSILDYIVLLQCQKKRNHQLQLWRCLTHKLQWRYISHLHPVN